MKRIWIQGDLVLCHKCIKACPRKVRNALKGELDAFAVHSDGWTSVPVCSACGKVHDKVTVGEEEEGES